jgi:hypothetical protein
VDNSRRQSIRPFPVFGTSPWWHLRFIRSGSRYASFSSIATLSLIPLTAGKDATEAFFGLHRHEILLKPNYARLQIGFAEGQKEHIKRPAPGDISRIPYAEPSWLAEGFYSPYFKEASLLMTSLCRVNAHVPLYHAVVAQKAPKSIPYICGRSPVSRGAIKRRRWKTDQPKRCGQDDVSHSSQHPKLKLKRTLLPLAQRNKPPRNETGSWKASKGTNTNGRNRFSRRGKYRCGGLKATGSRLALLL